MSGNIKMFELFNLLKIWNHPSPFIYQSAFHEQFDVSCFELITLTADLCDQNSNTTNARMSKTSEVNSQWRTKYTRYLVYLGALQHSFFQTEVLSVFFINFATGAVCSAYTSTFRQHPCAYYDPSAWLSFLDHNINFISPARQHNTRYIG